MQTTNLEVKLTKRLRNWRTAILVILLTSALGGSNTIASTWWETIKVKGDLRYRHEMIDKEDKDARHRHRIRARIGIYGTISEYTTFGIQFATGSDDPVSTNQTLDGAFSTKSVGIDLAYFEATHPKLEGFKLQGGKFKNPFFKPGKSELIWDSDWNPEGGVLFFNGNIENVGITLIGSGLWIDERSSDDDTWLGALQGVAKLNVNESQTSIAVGGSFFSYVNTEGFSPLFDAEDPMGNSAIVIDGDGEEMLRYANDFEIFEVYGEVTHEFDKFPMTIMFDYVNNSAADSLNTGWLAGLRAGKTKKPGSWAFRYIYREVEADAVVGAYADSDFRGGGTDAEGHEIGGALQLADNTAFKLSYFINKIGLQADKKADFRRLQVDLQLKF
jgi:hypothetical protein